MHFGLTFLSLKIGLPKSMKFLFAQIVENGTPVDKIEVYGGFS